MESQEGKKQDGREEMRLPRETLMLEVSRNDLGAYSQVKGKVEAMSQASSMVRK